MITEYKIEKEVPVPKTSGKGRKPYYPWDDMEVGDSIFFADGGRKHTQSAYQHGHRYGKKFVTKSFEGGVRIWRKE